jgi:hypothetical protein
MFFDLKFYGSLGLFTLLMTHCPNILQNKKNQPWNANFAIAFHKVYIGRADIEVHDLSILRN